MHLFMEKDSQRLGIYATGFHSFSLLLGWMNTVLRYAALYGTTTVNCPVTVATEALRHSHAEKKTYSSIFDHISYAAKIYEPP